MPRSLLPGKLWLPLLALFLTPTLRTGTNGTVVDVLVDTDVFIDHLRGAFQLRPEGNRLHYSIITRAELFAGNDATSVLHALLTPLREVGITTAIAEEAGRLRRSTGLRLPDALIAATALVHGMTLSTRNLRDFSRVNDLPLLPIG